MHAAIQALVTIGVALVTCVAYFWLSSWLLDKLIFPAKGPNAGRNIHRAALVRPWLFLFPALACLSLYLAYPVFQTLYLSLTDRSLDDAFVGFANYKQMWAEPKFHEALRNNALWLTVVPAAATGFGLMAAQLTDRLSWGNFAKSLIFMPMAISFVGASVIFKLIYEAKPAGQPQIGLINAIWLQFEGGLGSILFLKALPSLILLSFAALLLYLAWLFAGNWLQRATKLTTKHTTPAAQSVRGYGGGLLIMSLRLFAVGLCLWLAYLCLSNTFELWRFSPPYGKPQSWLTLPFWNSFFLMVVLVWIQTGFAMVILSAALRGIPEETIEAAILDGANPLQVFFRIKIPQIRNTIVVVWTTITLVVLKIFDIVYAMTNGQWETQVLANYMFDKFFSANDWGVGSASAMVIMLLVLPILVWNVINARREMRS